MYKKWISTLLLTSAVLQAQENDLCPPDCDLEYIDSCMCCPGPDVARLTVRHIEPGGIGYDEGYTSLDLFWAPNFGSNLYGFIDGRGHVFNDGKGAANLGLGLRYLLDCADLVTGLNVYGDWRQTKHTNFFQIGAGLELLWPCWDIRINGYAPVGNTRKSFRTGFEGFQGHEALTFKKWEAALWGIDAGLGYWLYRTDCFGVHATAVGYYFGSDFGKHAGGGLLRAKMQFWDWVELRGQVSYDSLFKWQGQGEIALSYSFGCPIKRYDRRACSCCNVLRLEERLAEQPERFEIIVTTNKTKTAPALSPITGDPLQFFFVNNTLFSGDGTFEHPFPTLFQAQIASSATDVIYVFPGDGTDKGMDAGIILKDDQILTSSFLPFPIHSKFGDFVIPAMDTTRPTISNISNVVTLANRNTVQGFIINGASVGVIALNPIESFTLFSNIININSNIGAAIGVNIANAFTGTFFAKDNTISASSLSASATGVAFNGSVSNADVQLINNVLSAKSNLSTATAFSIQGPSFTGKLQLTGNTFEAAANQNAIGIFINPFQGTAFVTGNEIKSASSNANSFGILASGFNGNLIVQNNSISAASPVGSAIGIELNNFVGTFSPKANTIAAAGVAGIATGILVNNFEGGLSSQRNHFLIASQNNVASGIELLAFNGKFLSNSDNFSIFSNTSTSAGIQAPAFFTGELSIQNSTIAGNSNTGTVAAVYLANFNGTFLANNNMISADSTTSIARGIFFDTTFNGISNIQNNSISVSSPSNSVGIDNLGVFTGSFIAQSNNITSQHNSGIYLQTTSGTILITDNTLTQTLNLSNFAGLNIFASNFQATILDNNIFSAATNTRAFNIQNGAGNSHLRLDGNTLSSPAFTDDGHFDNLGATFTIESINGFITGVELMNNNCSLTDNGAITYVVP